MTEMNKNCGTLYFLSSTDNRGNIFCSTSGRPTEEFPETRNLRRRNVASLTRGPEPSGVWRLLAQKISGWSGIDCGEIGQGSAITYTFIHQRRDGDGEQITSVHRIAGNGSREPLMIYGRRIRILNSVINSSCLWKPLCVPSPPLCPSISLSLSVSLFTSPNCQERQILE